MKAYLKSLWTWIRFLFCLKPEEEDYLANNQIRCPYCGHLEILHIDLSEDMKEYLSDCVIPGCNCSEQLRDKAKRLADYARRGKNEHGV